jgi:Uma2 family endonuclease
LFHRLAGDEVLVRGQNPVTLDNYSEPEPDLSIVVFRPDFYALSHPRPADVLLLIEVAESSGQKDRLIKQPAYALSGIREYWIVDLPQDLIEVYTQPVGSGYQSVRQVARGESLTPELLPDLTLRAEELLG